MIREEAIERVRSRFDKWALDNEDLIALQALGLVDVESEDERIQKGLIKVVSDIAGGWPFEKHRITKKEAIAYLEKQKESELLNNDEYHTVKVKILDRLYAHEKELEQLKKEQKSAEWSEDECTRKELIHFLLYKAGQLLDEETEHKFVAYLGKQKPAESSEDEKIRKAISAAICGTTAISILKANGASLPDALAYLEK